MSSLSDDKTSSSKFLKFFFISSIALFARFGKKALGAKGGCQKVMICALLVTRFLTTLRDQEDRVKRQKSKAELN